MDQHKSRISESANVNVALIALAWEIINSNPGSSGYAYPKNLEEFLKVHSILISYFHNDSEPNLPTPNSINELMSKYYKNDQT